MNKRLLILIVIGITVGILGFLLVFLFDSSGYLAALGLGLVFGSVIGLISVIAALVAALFSKHKRKSC